MNFLHKLVYLGNVEEDCIISILWHKIWAFSLNRILWHLLVANQANDLFLQFCSQGIITKVKANLLDTSFHHLLFRIGSNVISLDWVSIHIHTKNGAFCTWPVHIASDAKLLPFLITLVQTFGSECLFLLGTHLIVGHHDATAMSAILLIQEINSMKGCTTAREEIENESIGIVGYEETDGIVDGVKGLGEIKTLFSKKLLYQQCSIRTGIM